MLLSDAQGWKATRVANDGAALTYLIAEARRANAPKAMIDEMTGTYLDLARRIAKPKRRRRWLLGRRSEEALDPGDVEPRHEQLELITIESSPFELPPSAAG